MSIQRIYYMKKRLTQVSKSNSAVTGTYGSSIRTKRNSVDDNLSGVLKETARTAQQAFSHT